jgi:hypothetical protein
MPLSPATITFCLFKNLAAKNNNFHTAKILLQKPIRCFIPPPPAQINPKWLCCFSFGGCWGARGSSVTFQGVNAPQESPLGADPLTTP